MSRPHLKYRNIKAEAVQAAEMLLNKRPSQLEEEQQLQAGQEFVSEVCRVYGVRAPKFVLSRSYTSRAWSVTIPTVTTDSMGAETVRREGNIVLRKWMAFNLFRALRDYMNRTTGSNIDEDAWAASLYYSAKPVLFRKLARAGKIPGSTAEDTFTSETWERILEAGYGNRLGELTDSDFKLSWLEGEEDDDNDEEGNEDLPVEEDAASEDEILEDQIEDDEEVDVASILTRQAEVTEDPERKNDLLVAAEAASDPDEDAMVPQPTHQVVSPVGIDASVSSEIEDTGDGLANLGIVALRKLSRGVFSGGYNMGKPELIEALRQHGVRAPEATV